MMTSQIALALISFLGFCSHGRGFEKKEWWQTSVLYEIYPRSFKDTNGNGVGDLKGITQKLNYIVNLGVGSVWITPFFPSGGADQGYDITDFKAVDFQFGTMEDFDQLLAEAHKKGLKVVLDFVPNHTSDQHEWFLKSVDGIAPYTEYFRWENGTGPNKTAPPNNWISVFGGSSWSYHEKRKQFYYHEFSRMQPDLNYRSENVRKEMADVLRFWLDKGIDGWRMDAVEHIYEAATLDNEYVDPVTHQYVHNLTQSQPEVYELVTTWRALIDEYGAKTGRPRMMVLESYTDIEKDKLYYEYKGKKGANYPFNFCLVGVDRNTNASHVSALIHYWLDNVGYDVTSNWVISNHDIPRIVDKVGPELSVAFHMISLLLPGVGVVYNGEELGMVGGLVRVDQRYDKSNARGGRNDDNRDPQRTPMQWDDSENAGFSTAATTWLPVNSNYYYLNVAAQEVAAVSHLKVFRRIVALRTQDTFLHGRMSTYVMNKEWVLVIRRHLPSKDTYIVLVNFNSFTEEVNLTEVEDISTELYVVVASMNSGYKAGQRVTSSRNSATTDTIVLRPKASLVLIQTADGKPYVDPTDEASNHNSSARSSSLVVWVFLVFCWLCSSVDILELFS